VANIVNKKLSMMVWPISSGEQETFNDSVANIVNKEITGSEECSPKAYCL